MATYTDTIALSLNRWQALYHTLCSVGDPQSIFNTLVQAYAEPHRHYHTQAHIAACLALFDTVRPLFSRPAEAEWALWLHDIIYDTHAHDNEEQSALFAADVLRKGGAEASAKSASALILATRHTAIPHDNDTRLFVDIDLSILGSPSEVFGEYERAVRREYAWVPEELFREKRREILEEFLRREHLYLTDIFRRKFEAQARYNIRQSIDNLRQ